MTKCRIYTEVLQIQKIGHSGQSYKYGIMPGFVLGDDTKRNNI